MAVGLDVYCIVDLVRATSVRYLPKVVWAVIIVLVSFPAGALLYLFLGRDRDHGSKVPGLMTEAAVTGRRWPRTA